MASMSPKEGLLEGLRSTHLLNRFCHFEPHDCRKAGLVMISIGRAMVSSGRPLKRMQRSTPYAYTSDAFENCLVVNNSGAKYF
jgi:hypothetical protein